MKKAEAVIFDMDGTLYNFPNGARFGNSPLGAQVKENVTRYIANSYDCDESEAKRIYDDISTKYGGEISIGLERERGIDRQEFFDTTWDIDPQQCIEVPPNLFNDLAELDVEAVLLTAAPRIWVQRVLEYIGVSQVFDGKIFTGESDIRKPKPEAFLQITDAYRLNPTRVVSIGDQEYSDIEPARKLGMMTVRIGNDASSADFVSPAVSDAIQQLKREGII